MAADIREWLEGLGLGKYTEAFAENEIDLDAARDLTENDLKELGIAMGPRKKLLRAIAELSSASGMPSKELADSSTERFVPEPQAQRPHSEAERRQLTVMFCDLVGSTALSGRLDPEDMRDIILAYQNMVAGEVVRFDGHVAKYMGDGVLAYFGWPTAHEDEAERAVRCGLSILQATAVMNTPRGEPLAVRIGIATGLVVVGDLVGEGAAQEEAVVGETPNLAARLQSLAKPNTLVISPTTQRLTGNRFECVNLGEHELKGFAEAVQAWAVSRLRDEDALASPGDGTNRLLVGRDQELELLRARWVTAQGVLGKWCCSRASRAWVKHTCWRSCGLRWVETK